MTAITTAVRLLREAATELKKSHTLNGDWGNEHDALTAYNAHIAAAADLERIAPQCLAQIQEPAQPVCWIRFCSDGSTEGPIMHSQICEARKTSGAWTPLYAGAAPAAPVDEHAAFESIFPIPHCCQRCGDGYAATGYNAWDAYTHCARWDGWKARAMLAAAPQAPAAPVDIGVVFDMVALVKQLVREHLAAEPNSLLAGAAMKYLQRHGLLDSPLRLHSDDAALDRFTLAMRAKLAAAREKGRGGWETCPPEALNRMLHEHIAKGDPLDVANFCMFLWCTGQPTTVAAPAAPAVDARNAARLDWLQRNAEVRFSLDYEQVEISFPAPEWLIGVDSIDEAIDAAIADQAAAQAKEGGAA